jgi:serine/threonine protein phosphatase PrpC
VGRGNSDAAGRLRGLPTRVGSVRIEEAIGTDDARGRTDDGALAWVAFGTPRALALEAAATREWSSVRPSLLAATDVIEEGTDERGARWLALRQHPDAVEVGALDAARFVDVDAFVTSLLDAIAAIEDAGQTFAPEGFDVAWRDGCAAFRRLRAIRARVGDERVDARTTLELVGELLPEPLVVRLPSAVVELLLPHRERASDADRTHEAVRADWARALASARPTTREEGTLAVRRHIGLLRERNEDAGTGAALPDRRVMVVCDGVSASAHADIASSLVAHTVGDRLLIAAPSPATMAEAIRHAHRCVLEEQRHLGDEPMGTTVVASCEHGGRTLIGWVGDSRAYWIGTEGTRLLTHDHSWLEEIVASGMATVEQALASPLAHALTRCIGPMPGADDHGHAEPEVIELTLGARGYLMLCTDGLWNYFPTARDLVLLLDELLYEHAPAHAIAERLVSGALARGGHDNVTVAVARIG